MVEFAVAVNSLRAVIKRFDHEELSYAPNSVPRRAMSYIEFLMTIENSAAIVALARAGAIAEQYGALAHVRAVALGGSLAAGTSDMASDIDLYVYATATVSISGRAAIASADPHAEIDNRWFGPEDAWVDSETGISIDVVFRGPRIEDDLARVLVRHQAQLGYTTAVWANVLASRSLVDPTGWFAQLQQQARQPYPEPLRQAIIALNLPLLRQVQSAYGHQLEKAVARADLGSVNHRVAALLASYFDVLFALNRVPHPGEKRLVPFALEHCRVVPEAMSAQIAALLRTAGEPGREVLRWAEALSAGLEQLAGQEFSSGN